APLRPDGAGSGRDAARGFGAVPVRPSDGQLRGGALMTVAPLPGQQPFLWGRGGKRMSMDDIALRRRLAAQQMAQGSDYSPVGHWTQGLAGVANGLACSVDIGRGDRAEAAQRAAQG